MASPSSDIASPNTLRLAQIGLVVVAALLVAGLGASKLIYPLDSYFYLAKARSLGSLGFLTVPWNDGIDRRFFWGYSLALSLPFKVLGEASFWVIAGLMHAWTGLVFTRIARLLGLSPQLRLGTLALLLFNPLALKWASVPMSEGLMVALGITAVYFALRYHEDGNARELLWAAALAGLALLTRVEGVFVGMAVAALSFQRLYRQKRRALVVIALAAFLVPEALHVSYLMAQTSGRAVFALFDEARLHRSELHYLTGFWSHLRAPQSLLFRFSAEPWLYARYFPGWLSALQSLTLAVYVVALFGTLVAGFYLRGYAFWSACGLVVFALLHSAWYDVFERYDYLAYPASALVLGWSLDAALAWAQPRLRQGVALGLCFFFAAVGAAYGIRSSQLHGEQLTMAQAGRDLRALARTINEANPSARPVVTDLGPPLAFYLSGKSYLNDSEPMIYDDVVPTGELGRQFLLQKDVAAIVSERSVNEIASEFALQSGQFRELPVKGTTALVLEAGLEAGQ